MPRIMVIEDEPSARRLLEVLLNTEGFEVISCKDGEEALSSVEKTKPDLFLVDLTMPGMDGLELTQALRSKRDFQRVPILVVTARGHQADKYEAFQSGADAFLSKPFDSLELLYNVRALLRLSSGAEMTLSAGDLQIDPDRYKATLAGREIHLTKMETAVLLVMLQEPGKIYSAEELSEAIHEQNRSVDAVHAHIRNLRNKMEQDPKNPRYLCTMGRKGYYLDVK